MVRLALLLPLLLVACSPGHDDPTGVRTDEDHQLNTAAADLDASMNGNTAP